MLVPMKIWQLNQQLKEANHQDQAWHMVTRERSSSRAVWKTRSSSTKRSVVAHAATYSTAIEVGEEFEEAWKVAVVENYKENPMMGSILPFGIRACKIFCPLNQQST